jgi:hypothetical protein
MFGILWLFLIFLLHFSYCNSRTSPVFSGSLHLFSVCMVFPQPNWSPIKEISNPLDNIPFNTCGAHSQDPHIRPNPTFLASSLAGCPQNRCHLPSEYGSLA